MLTQQLVKELFDYCPDTGIFRYATNRGKVKAGQIAGGVHRSKSVYLRVNGKKELAHRIAWLYVYGELPIEVDHIDQNRTNNAIRNLRNVTHTVNMKNKPKYSNNSTGVTGVCMDKRVNRYRAYITIEGKQQSLGYFSTLEEAAQARKVAQKAAKEFTPQHGI